MRMRAGAMEGVESIEIARSTRPRGVHAFVAGRFERTPTAKRGHVRLNDIEE
jgi:hypothetical protein